ncbi:sodium:solute symporter [Flavobacterium cheniae]|uniref:SSS family transporter n=1 Tax=Flavobacterium cheniae TaxID=295428 RepID=A0A562KSC3_9FLAO|nr:sodium:solute symporter [Flavobacterium cheniae]TDR25474.1 SSS family transporter [Flavobacterium cheniae]TWH98339.1 SSS family transporter [Flavobacterium cheniae]
MEVLDWIVLSTTLFFIVIYGALKTKGSANVKDYLLDNNETPWFTVGVSVMATQASAITFLSTPGQAYHDGMGFVQFYFGLPLAMIVIAYTFIPIYHRLKVYTAYEYLEQRFNIQTRTLAAILFLIQRGLGTGITIYAPSIILSALLGWNLNMLNIIIGILVIVYTVTGGTKAVNVTQKQQMFVIMSGMFIIFFYILANLPQEVDFSNVLHIAGANGKMDILDFSYNPETRYTFWSGITGGFFLMLSYFGTDQSQVGRYLSGKSVKESQMGLIMNGLLKVPMQFFILLTGVLVFVFFQFNDAPLHFNPTNVEKVKTSEQKEAYENLEKKLTELNTDKKIVNQIYIEQLKHNEYDNPILKKQMVALSLKEKDLREKAKVVISKVDEKTETNDKDYVFLYFILNYLPKGLLGLLLAVIFSAAMSSSASGLNSLGATSAIDIYKRNVNAKSDKHYVYATQYFTVFWGIVAIGFACVSSLFENLIQLVNIIGSIFYGTVLGIFLIGFYINYVKGKAVFIAACISQTAIFYIFYLDVVGYLWLNFIGALLTIGLSLVLQKIFNKSDI